MATALLFAAALLSSCTGDGPTAGDGTVTVTVTPASLRLVVGDEEQLGAAVSGGDLDGWEVVDGPGVVSVSEEGVVTALAPGLAQVAAIAGTARGVALVQVEPAGVATLNFRPLGAAVQVGSTVQLALDVQDARGRPLPATGAQWESSNPNVATVDASGRLIGRAPGMTTVTVTLGGRSATLDVTIGGEIVGAVEIVGEGRTVTIGGVGVVRAIVRGTSGAVLTGRALTWQSSDPSVLRIRAADGDSVIVEGLRGGTVQLVASAEGRSASIRVTVPSERPPVASVAIEGGDRELLTGDTVRLEAIARGPNGEVVPGRQVQWGSSDPTIATIRGAADGSAELVAVAPGTAHVTAVIDGRAGTMTVTVATRPQVAVAVEISETPATIGVGGQVGLEARVIDAEGRPIPGRPITWTSLSPSIATVGASSGVVTAVAAGTARIRAASGTLADTVTITVTSTPAPVPATVVVTGGSSSIQAGASVALTAVVRDADGDALPSAPVTWQSSAPAVATVNASGVVTGVSVGTATITATSGAASGTFAVTVTAAPGPVAATVTISAPATEVAAGAQLQLAAVVRDTEGSVMPGATLSWQSSHPAVATVSASGVVTGISAGTATITATSGAASGTFAVQVVAVPVARVQVSAPGAPTVQIGQTVQLQAELFDDQNRPLTGRAVAWTSSNPGVAAVDASTGVVTGVSVGTARITATSEGVAGTLDMQVLADPGPTPGAYSIELQFVGDVPQTVRSAVLAAQGRWESIIIGDLPDAPANTVVPAGLCRPWQPERSGAIDDIVIFVTVGAIDGPGGQLGVAGPCGMRANGLPLAGTIELDVADIETLRNQALLQPTALHEMGHVLGFGTTSPWDSHVVAGADPRFTGANAVAAWQAAGGSGTIPLENSGGAQAVNGHWRETVLGTELMTTLLGGGTANPLSAVTVRAMQDLGYTVSLDGAEPWTLGQALRLPGARQGTPLDIGAHEKVLRARFVLRNGRFQPAP